MTPQAQRLLEAITLVQALDTRIATADETTEITDAIEVARQEMRTAAQAYVASKQGK